MAAMAVVVGYGFDLVRLGETVRRDSVVLYRQQELLELAADWPPPSVGEPGVHLEGELDAAGLPRIAVEVGCRLAAPAAKLGDSLTILILNPPLPLPQTVLRVRLHPFVAQNADPRHDMLPIIRLPIPNITHPAHQTHTLLDRAAASWWPTLSMECAANLCRPCGGVSWSHPTTAMRRRSFTASGQFLRGESAHKTANHLIQLPTAETGAIRECSFPSHMQLP